MEKRSLSGTLIVILLAEKVIQHVFVSCAFLYDIGSIRSRVVPDYRILMINGAIIAALFMVALWGRLRGRKWSLGLVASLAAFDLVGEFYAQGTMMIAITVSFIVALILLILSYSEHRARSSGTSGSSQIWKNLVRRPGA